jgi:hypothetical protein
LNECLQELFLDHNKQEQNMNPPITSPLGYVGVLLLIAGFFLILAGMNIIRIQQVTVSPGMKTWIFGIIILIAGAISLILDFTVLKEAKDNSSDSATNQPAAVITSGEDILAEAKTWPVVFEDSFEEEKGVWPLGDFTRGDLSGTLSLNDEGKYKWEMTSLGSSYHYVTPAVDPISNFSLSVDVKLTEGKENQARYGLIYRANGYNFYAFRIEEDRKYRIRITLPDWVDLTGQMSSGSINDDLPNKLTVIALDDRFIFLINDHIVEDLRDTNLKKGNVGLIGGLNTSGKSAVLEFDNFILRKKP